MKTPLILPGVVSVVAYLLWFGYHGLKSLAAGYGNANPATGPGDVTLVFVTVALLTAACVVYSFFAPASLARVIALAPLAFILLGQGCIAYRQDANRAKHRKSRDAHRAANEVRLSRFSRDYVRREDPDARFTEIKTSFLTLDREHQTLVHIDVDYDSNLSAYGIGRINGDRLDTPERVDENYYRQYVDPEGKSIFDRYTLRHQPDLGAFDFHLEKYKP